ncbi:MAG: UDP-N-acetylmuramate--L-alanine ligase, partial [Bacteroidales bacterium]|nr:UDP-N-acetylmuramate--L-alanine ligase [Bacteroidales bacterium]
MTDTGKLAGVYFIGIGGIGMSALARYFVSKGVIVAGYDRTESSLTRELEKEGCSVSYLDDESAIPPLFKNSGLKDKILVVYTPAIPPESAILNFFRKEGYVINKRSEVLGAISRTTSTIAVAGTHGKTSVSTLTAHILTHSGRGCSAFLGGISKNYNSNLILSDSEYTVIEADEYDRSFHRLSPLFAVITSADADHLDIYGTYESMLEGYSGFCSKIRSGGKLLLNEKVTGKITVPEGLQAFVYGFSESCDFRIVNPERSGESYRFGIQAGQRTMKNLVYPFPGIMNIENACAASALCMMCGVDEDGIRSALATFAGVRRRFDV